MKRFMKDNNLVAGERFNVIIEGLKHKCSLYFDENLHIWEDRSAEDKKDRKASRTLVYMVLGGKCEIEKLPFIPKFDEEYWFYCNNSGVTLVERYQGSLLDALLIKNNFAFRTREESEDPNNIARVKEYCGVLNND